MIKKAVVLAGGLATRFLPISKSIPKEMLPILNKPVLQIVLENLKDAGIKEVLIINARNKEAINRHFDKNVELEQRLLQDGKLDLLKQVQETTNLCDIYYKQQLEAKGTGYSLKSAKGFLNDEPFVLMFGDELVFSKKDNVIKQLLNCYNKFKTNVIAVQKVPKKEVYKYGIIKTKNKIGKYFLIDDIIEKPKISDAPSNISYIGPAILTNEIFASIDNLKVEEGKEIIVTEAFKSLAKDGKIIACNIEGERHDLGSKLGLLKANIYAGLQDAELRQQIIKYLKQILKDNL